MSCCLGWVHQAGIWAMKKFATFGCIFPCARWAPIMLSSHSMMESYFRTESPKWPFTCLDHHGTNCMYKIYCLMNELTMPIANFGAWPSHSHSFHPTPRAQLFISLSFTISPPNFWHVMCCISDLDEKPFAGLTNSSDGNNKVRHHLSRKRYFVKFDQ